MRSLAAVVVAASWTVAGVAAQSYDPIQNFCRRFGHQAAVIGNRLYIDGGQVNYEDNGQRNERNFTNKQLVFHDLTTTKSDSMPPLVANLSKPDNVPSVIGGALWPDNVNKKLYMYGGEFPDGTPDELETWSYDVTSNKWSSRSVQDPSITRASFGGSAVAEDRGVGYYFGGYLGEQNTASWIGPKIALNSLIQYDFVHDNWKNSSYPNDNAGRAEGAMFYVPLGDGGLLLYFGGIRAPNGNVSQTFAAPMEEIEIYDIANEQWYRQNATGDVPNIRRKFCGDIAAAPDSSSFNMYIYGGLGFAENATGYNDVYMLSVPSFTWTRAYPDAGPYNRTGAKPHYSLSCNVVNNAQMLVIGGQFPEASDESFCDVPELAGTHNLNMGKNNPDNAYWAKFNVSLNTYDVPNNITKVIGGGPSGGATVKSPALGWAHPDLKTEFSRIYTPLPRAPTATPSSSSNSNGTSSDNGGASSGMSTTTKIAIAVPVAVVGAALLIGLVVFLYRRRQTDTTIPGNGTDATKNSQQQQPLHPTINTGQANGAGGLYGGAGHAGYMHNSMREGMYDGPSPVYPDSPPHSPSPSYQAHGGAGHMPNLADAHFYQHHQQWDQPPPIHEAHGWPSPGDRAELGAASPQPEMKERHSN